MWVKSSSFDTPWTSFLFPHYPTLPRFLPFPLSWPNKDGLSTHEEKKFIHLVCSIIEVEFSSNMGQISFSFNTLSSLFFCSFSLCNPTTHPSTFPFPFLNLCPFFPHLTHLTLVHTTWRIHTTNLTNHVVQLSLKLQKEPQKNPLPQKRKEKRKEKEKF